MKVISSLVFSIPKNPTQQQDPVWVPAQWGQKLRIVGFLETRKIGFYKYGGNEGNHAVSHYPA